MAEVKLSDLIAEDIKCQCYKCNAVFTYKDVKKKYIKLYDYEIQEPVCPYCNGKFTNTDNTTLNYFEKYLNTNYDEKLY